MIYNEAALAEYQKSMDAVITFLEGLDFSREDRETREFHSKTLLCCIFMTQPRSYLRASS